MREHKYRAWTGEKMVSPDHITRRGIAYWSEDSLPNGSVCIMQYTGVKDSNEVEIYEEDIFLIENKVYTVEYVEDQCRYVLTTGEGYDTNNCIDLNCDVIQHHEVKGNTFSKIEDC
tara:strand:+ start:902 stop:1249 length:348 start_codon:yes stop_codon:yes gene_type:complete